MTDESKPVSSSKEEQKSDTKKESKRRERKPKEKKPHDGPLREPFMKDKFRTMKSNE